MKNPTIREIFDERVASKYGNERNSILKFYDTMLARHNGDELQALTEFETILKKFTPAAALKAQQDRLAQDIADLQKGIEAYASVDCKNLLSPVAKAFSDAIEGKTLVVESPLEKLKKLQAKIKAREGKELELEESPRMRVGILQTEETLRQSNGVNVLERKRVYKSVASENSKAGLELEVVFSR